VQDFLRWLSGEPGFVRRIRQADIEYLNLSTKDCRSLQQSFSRTTPKLVDFNLAVHNMPITNPIERRDQALMAFMGITGIRAGAAVTLRIKHLDPSRRTVRQNPREVATKFGKYIHSVLLPISHEFNEIVLSWHAFLITELGFGPNDPLFPKSVFVKGKNYGSNRRIIVNLQGRAARRTNSRNGVRRGWSASLQPA
jgi:integrase